MTVKVTIFPAEVQAQASRSAQEENPPAEDPPYTGWALPHTVYGS